MEANGDDKTIFTLSELTGAVRDTLEATFPETYWVRVETSDVRVNAASGHCYLEFIEKNPKTNQLVAKARGSIWAKVFRMLKPYFEMETGQTFTSGLKVLVKVTIEFHELYGFSLNVVDIDPTYTIGDMARKRQEIIRQLQADGVFTLNKELTFPDFPTRIAVITSPTAAGYEDFLNQLLHNQAGYPFYPKLFPALMQGEKTEESVIAALERIDACREYFDVVVIALNKAVKDEIIPTNPAHKINYKDRPQQGEATKQYLTFEEVKALVATPCKYEVLKQAFLFACFCGLRYSDIKWLEWGKIQKIKSGEMQVEIKQQKTGEPLYLPLSANALQWLPERGLAKDSDKVFALPHVSTVEKFLPIWAKDAGINKHITLHVSRHIKSSYPLKTRNLQRLSA